MFCHFEIGLRDELLHGGEGQRDGPHGEVGDDHGLPVVVDEGAEEEDREEDDPPPGGGRGGAPVADHHAAGHEGVGVGQAEGLLVGLVAYVCSGFRQFSTKSNDIIM